MTNLSKLCAEKANLIIIDIQEKLLPAISNKDDVVKNTKILIETAKNLDLNIVLSEQYPKGLGSTIPEIKEMLNSQEQVEKTSFSVCGDNKELFDKLLKQEKNQFIIAGIEAHICVYQTVKDLLISGAEVFLVSDAVGSRKDASRLQIINTLISMGAVVLPTESILFELLENSKNKHFKNISKLIK